MEPKTNTTENTQRNPLQIPETPLSGMFIERVQNLSVELQRQVFEVFSLEQTQAKNDCLKLEHQRRIETADYFSKEQKLERNLLIQQMNQPDTEAEDNNMTLENTQMILSTSKKVPPQQVARSEFSIPTTFLFIL